MTRNRSEGETSREIESKKGNAGAHRYSQLRCAENVTMNEPIAIRSDSSAPVDGVLYVVLHGLICLVDAGKTGSKDNGYVAYLNEMGSEHRYMCGDFLSEIPMDLGSTGYTQFLDLVNVEWATKTADNTLSTANNAIVRLTNLPTPSPADVRVVIGLPRPNRISYFIVGDLAPNALQGDIAALVQPPPKQISGIRVFEYSFKDFHLVRLQSGPRTIVWECPEPVSINGKNINVAVLHIFNEPPEELPTQQAADHNLREFNRTLNYLGAKLALTIPGTVPDPDNSMPPDGMIFEERAALDDRRKFALILMFFLRQILGLQSDIHALEAQVPPALRQPGLTQKREVATHKADSGITISLNLAEFVLGLNRMVNRGGGGAGGSQVCGGANGAVGL